MREVAGQFNDREIAILLWIAALLAWMLSRVEGRTSLGSLVRAALAPAILRLGALALVWIGGSVLLLAEAGFWGVHLAKDTLVWLLGTATVLFMRSARAAEEAGFFRRVLSDAFKLTLLIQFVSSNYVLPLAAELALVPFLVILGVLIAIADFKDGHPILRRPLTTLLYGVSGSMLILSATQAVSKGGDFAKAATYQQMLVGPVLTLLFLPALYLLALYCEYEAQFIRLPLWLGNDPERLVLVRQSIVQTCRLDLYRLQRLKGRFYLEVQEAATDEEAVALVERLSGRKAA